METIYGFWFGSSFISEKFGYYVTCGEVRSNRQLNVKRVPNLIMKQAKRPLYIVAIKWNRIQIYKWLIIKDISIKGEEFFWEN